VDAVLSIAHSGVPIKLNGSRRQNSMSVGGFWPACAESHSWSGRRLPGIARETGHPRQRQFRGRADTGAAPTSGILDGSGHERWVRIECRLDARCLGSPALDRLGHAPVGARASSRLPDSRFEQECSDLPVVGGHEQQGDQHTLGRPSVNLTSARIAECLVARVPNVYVRALVGVAQHVVVGLPPNAGVEELLAEFGTRRRPPRRWVRVSVCRPTPGSSWRMPKRLLSPPDGTGSCRRVPAADQREVGAIAAVDEGEADAPHRGPHLVPRCNAPTTNGQAGWRYPRVWARCLSPRLESSALSSPPSSSHSAI
jgi:hypothetical protein